MKKILFSCLFLSLMPFNIVSSQTVMPDSIYIYNVEGMKDWYKIQQDVFCFNLKDNVKYTSSIPDCVEEIIYFDNSYSQFNEVHFKPSSTLLDRINFIDYIKSLDNFHVFSHSITKHDTIYQAGEYYQTDDLVIVTFRDPLLSESLINAFTVKYDLEMVYKPLQGLSNKVSWAYFFKIKINKTKNSCSIKLSQIINEEESLLVAFAEPNSYSVTPLTCDPIAELTPPFLNNINGSWYIENSGGIIKSGKSGILDADADICDCWSEGAIGTGIKIGVIDHNGFQFSHPDLSNANIPYVFNLAGPMTTGTTWPLHGRHYADFRYSTETSSHSMNVVGVIAATPNNKINNDGSVIGSAYGAEVVPYTCGNPLAPGDNSSNTYIIAAIQQAIADTCDILNMSLNIGLPGTIGAHLRKAVEEGRPDPNNPNNKRGIIIVAGAGNSNSYNDPAYPAKLSSTISVGWTNPEDYRASPNSPGLGGSWGLTNNRGSNYGMWDRKFDVVAPGCIIRTTNFTSEPDNGYSVLNGASLSTPIVSSIAAMILQVRPDLTYLQVKEVIRGGAEKVHSTVNGGIYNYINGLYSNEMFYGRVSCINSLNLATTLGLENTKNDIQTIVKNKGEGIYFIETPQNKDGKLVEIYSLTGRKLIAEEIKQGVDEFEIDLSSYGSGVYLLKIYNNFGAMSTSKLIR